MMRATQKFKIGDNVTMTDFAAERLHIGQYGSRSKTGVVCGFSRDCQKVLIKRDGLKTSSLFLPDFWELTAQSNQAGKEG
jgi:ribosomal protein L21E